MNLKSILHLTAAGIVLAACQSNNYQVKGTVKELSDGDTIFITRDLQTGIPSDTAIVKDGKFSFSGEADSVQLCMVFSAARNEINAPFFIEPGNISIHLSEEPGEERVGGTLCNDQWQELNDSVMVIGAEINRIAEHIYGNNLDEQEKQKGMDRIDQLNQRFSALVVRTAKRNIHNEFGYFLLTYYPEELIDNQTRAKLIDDLPSDMRERPAIKELQKQLKIAAETAEGATISDFEQSTPDGTPLSIMSEVSQHKVTIIDFWASWCGPCRQEMPFMIQLYNTYKDQGLGIVGVSLDSERDAWLQAIRQLGIAWPQMSDLKGWDNAAAQMFNINSIPHTIVVDRQGKILQRGLRGEDLQQFIEEQLK